MPKSFKKFKPLVEAARRPKILQERKNQATRTKLIPNLIQCQNGLKAKNDYLSYVNFIFFYLWRHPLPCQKRWKKLNKSRLVLLKHFFALEWSWKPAKMRPRCARTAQMSHLGPSWTPRWHHKTHQNGTQTGSKSNREKAWKKNVVGPRSDHRKSEEDPDLSDAAPTFPTPYPFSSGQPREDTAYLWNTKPPLWR